MILGINPSNILFMLLKNPLNPKQVLKPIRNRGPAPGLERLIGTLNSLIDILPTTKWNLANNLAKTRIKELTKTKRMTLNPPTINKTPQPTPKPPRSLKNRHTEIKNNSF